MARRKRTSGPGFVQDPLVSRHDEPEDTSPALVVLAFDPGETTGWSVWRAPIETLCTQGTPKTLARCKWALGQIRPADADLRRGEGDSATVDRMLEVGRWSYEEFVHEDDEFVLVREGFTLRMMSMDPNLLAPVRVNAIFKDRMRAAGNPYQMYEQQPGEAKRVVTDQRLRAWGVYRPGMEHARDAERHAILFLRRVASTPALRRRIGFTR